MKRIVLLCTALFSFMMSQAQEGDAKRGYIGIAIGPSFPFSDFASTDRNNDDAGYALNGGNLNLSFGYRLGKNLGIAAMISGTQNPVNEDALETYFRDEYPGANWDIDADNWRLGGFMIGGMASFPAGDRFTFDLRLLGGILNSTSPEIRATASNGGISVFGKREEQTVNTAAFDLGFVFRYQVAGPLCFTANADFISANPRFENVTTTTTFNTYTTNFDQSYNTLNLTFGLAFLLN